LNNGSVGKTFHCGSPSAPQHHRHVLYMLLICVVTSYKMCSTEIYPGIKDDFYPSYIVSCTIYSGCHN
jgi:hypothetical protein